MSQDERDRVLQQFEINMVVKRTLVAAELLTGVDCTSCVGAGGIFSKLTGSCDFKPHAHAELRARSIVMAENEEPMWTLAEKRSKI